MIPACMLNRGITVATIAATAALLLCALSLAIQTDPAAASLSDLANTIALRNAPLCICVLAWGVLIADAERGYPATRVQYASVILFFGTIVPVFSALRGFSECFALARRVLSL